MRDPTGVTSGTPHPGRRQGDGWRRRLALAAGLLAGSVGSASAASATVQFDGRTYELDTDQCLRDYASPIQPDVRVAFSLHAVPVGTPEALRAPLRVSPEHNPHLDVLAAMAPVLERGSVLSVMRLADGSDVLSFYPTPAIDEAVLIIDPAGFFTLSGQAATGTATATDAAGNPRGPLSFEAHCP
jgi:hypothetical protein